MAILVKINNMIRFIALPVSVDGCRTLTRILQAGSFLMFHLRLIVLEK